MHQPIVHASRPPRQVGRPARREACPAVRHRAGRAGLRTALLGVLLAFGLAGCESLDRGDTARSAPERRAVALADAGRHADAARIYEALARAPEETDPRRYALLAARQWLRADRPVRAGALLEDVERPARGRLATLWSLVAAESALAAGDRGRALELLDELGIAGLSLGSRITADRLRAQALFETGRPANAVEILVRRELWLDDAEAVAANHRLIWEGLAASDGETLAAALERLRDPILRGWLELGVIAASAAPGDYAFRAALADWREAHPRHPALASLLPSLLGEGVTLAGRPERLALLLPLSGRNAAAGTAVRDGFLGGHFAMLRPEDPVAVAVYDTNAGGAIAAYRTALEEGAELVVGPLLKPAVGEIAAAGAVSVPTLALNTLPEELAAPEGLYQFALAPEDEAAQAAERVLVETPGRVVALAPYGSWGERVLASFAQRLAEGGGRLLDFRNYDPAERDFSAAIEELMRLDESVARYRKLRNLLGVALQFEPRRRQDIDAVFLAATAATGRLIRPQLRFHYAGDLAVVSTSAISAFDGRSNADLSGIRFPEIPWVLDPDERMAALRREFETYWPAARVQPRLFAMGYDAYRLVGVVGAGPGFEPLEGATGTLSMDAMGRVHRRLEWARFVGGEIVPDPLPARAEGAGDDTGPGMDRGIGDSAAGDAIGSGDGVYGTAPPGETGSGEPDAGDAAGENRSGPPEAGAPERAPGRESPAWPTRRDND